MQSSNRFCEKCGQLVCACAVALLSFAGPSVERTAVGACIDQVSITTCAPSAPASPDSGDGEAEIAASSSADTTAAPPPTNTTVTPGTGTLELRGYPPSF